LGLHECGSLFTVVTWLYVAAGAGGSLEGRLSPVEGVRVVKGDLEIYFTRSTDNELPLLDLLGQ